MEWNSFVENAFPYLKDKIVKDGHGNSDCIHPLITQSAYLAYRTINLNNPHCNRLIILLPNKFAIPYWVTSIVMLKILKLNYDENQTQQLQFQKGQKLLFANKCIVEYESHEIIDGKPYIKVKCSQECYWLIPENKELSFERVNTQKRLSTIGRVQRAYRECPDLKTPLDRLLGIRTLGNKSFFTDHIVTISPIGKTKNFIENHFFNGNTISDYIFWGKLSSDGILRGLLDDRFESIPSCIVSPIIDSVENLFNEDVVVKGIILDGAESLVSNYSCFADLILDNNIPTVVFSDLTEVDKLEKLMDAGFKLWHWNESLLNKSLITSHSTSPRTPFKNIDNSVKNYVKKNYKCIKCEDNSYDSLSTNISAIKGWFEESGHELLLQYWKILRIFNCLTRLLHPLSEDMKNNTRTEISKINANILRLRVVIPPDIFENVNIILHDLEKHIEKDNKKLEAAKQYIGHCDSKIAIFHGIDEDYEISKHFWEIESNRLGKNRIRVIGFADLQNYDSEELPDEIIVPGWLNSCKMNILFNSNISSIITSLLYSFETKWYNSGKKRHRKNTSFEMRGSSFKNLFGEDFNHEAVDYIPPSDIDDTKEEMSEHEISSEKVAQAYIESGNSQEGKVKAKLIRFNHGRFSFVSESHRLPVITDIMINEGSDIYRKNIKDIKVGDYIYDITSDRDILAEKATEDLNKNGNDWVVKNYKNWQIALISYFLGNEINCDFDKLYNKLIDAGLKREPITVISWLYGKRIIGPKNQRNVIPIIAKLTGDGKLNTYLDESIKSVRIMRSEHLRASRALNNKMKSELPDIINSITLGQGFEVEGYGEIEVLKIEEIGSQWLEIGYSSVNRIIKT